MKKFHTGVAVLVAVFAVAGLAAAPAQAAAGSRCGSGYRFLKAYPMKGLDNGITGGYVSVYYNSGKGKNCAIARPLRKWAGKVSHLQVQLSTAKRPGFVDDGQDKNYHFYAGPIYIKARHQCIDVRGIFHHRGERYVANAWDVHCG